MSDEQDDNGKTIENTCNGFLTEALDRGEVEEELRELLSTATRELSF